jgi:hypothetical protein
MPAHNDIRTHRSPDKDAPAFRPIQRTEIINSHAFLGGLHHYYIRVQVFAEAMLASNFSGKVLEYELASRSDLDANATAWRSW